MSSIKTQTWISTPTWVTVINELVTDILVKKGVLKKPRWKRTVRTFDTSDGNGPPTLVKWPCFTFRLGLSTRAEMHRNGTSIHIRKQYPSEVEHRAVVPPIYVTDEAAEPKIFTNQVQDLKELTDNLQLHQGLMDIAVYIADILQETPDVESLYTAYGVPSDKIKVSLKPDYSRNIFFGGYVTDVKQTDTLCCFNVTDVNNPTTSVNVQVELRKDTVDYMTVPAHPWDEGCMYYVKGLNGAGDGIEIWLSEEQFAAYYTAV